MHATRDTNAFMLCRGVGGRVMRGVRSPERASLIRGRFQARARRRSNKRMHATRDTNTVIHIELVGGRVMRSVRLLGRSETSTD
jgi:hypothetical protein